MEPQNDTKINQEVIAPEKVQELENSNNQEQLEKKQVDEVDTSNCKPNDMIIVEDEKTDGLGESTFEKLNISDKAMYGTETNQDSDILSLGNANDNVIPIVGDINVEETNILPKQEEINKPNEQIIENPEVKPKIVISVAKPRQEQQQPEEEIKANDEIIKSPEIKIESEGKPQHPQPQQQEDLTSSQQVNGSSNSDTNKLGVGRSEIRRVSGSCKKVSFVEKEPEEIQVISLDPVENANVNHRKKKIKYGIILISGIAVSTIGFTLSKFAFKKPKKTNLIIGGLSGILASVVTSIFTWKI